MSDDLAAEQERMRRRAVVLWALVAAALALVGIVTLVIVFTGGGPHDASWYRSLVSGVIAFGASGLFVNRAQRIAKNQR